MRASGKWGRGRPPMPLLFDRAQALGVGDGADHLGAVAQFGAFGVAQTVLRITLLEHANLVQVRTPPLGLPAGKLPAVAAPIDVGQDLPNGAVDVDAIGDAIIRKRVDHGVVPSRG